MHSGNSTDTIKQIQGCMSELGNTRAQTGVVGLARSKALDGVDGHSWITHAPSEQNLARVVTGLAGLWARESRRDPEA